MSLNQPKQSDLQIRKCVRYMKNMEKANKNEPLYGGPQFADGGRSRVAFGPRPAEDADERKVSCGPPRAPRLRPAQFWRTAILFPVIKHAALASRAVRRPPPLRRTAAALAPPSANSFPNRQDHRDRRLAPLHARHSHPLIRAPSAGCRPKNFSKRFDRITKLTAPRHT